MNQNNLIREAAETLIAGWRNDWLMSRVGVRISPSNIVSFEERALHLASRLGVPFVKFDQPCRVFVREKYRMLNDMLWDGRNDAVCTAWLVRQLGGRASKTVPVTVKAREVDRRTDWGVCK